MTVQERIQYWQASAQSDLDASVALFSNRNYLHMGFFCHLAVEKHLKAYYWAFHGKEPPYIHNLLKLAAETKLNDRLSVQQRDLLALLMPLNLKGRYPDDQETILSNLTNDDFKDILQRTKEFCAWMQSLSAQ